MQIIYTIVGCLIGVLVYSLVGLVAPIASWGVYSTGILVAFCLIATASIGYVPGPWRK